MIFLIVICQDCFLEEISSFESEESFISFETVLRNKLVNLETMKKVNKPTLIDDFRCDGPYQCNSCKTKWVVSAPDYSWRGYFVNNNLEGKVFDVKTKQVEIDGFTARYGLFCKSKMKINKSVLTIFRNRFSFHSLLEPVKLPISIPGIKFPFKKCKEDVFGNIIIAGNSKTIDLEITISPAKDFILWNFYKESIIDLIDNKLQ